MPTGSQTGWQLSDTAQTAVTGMHRSTHSPADVSVLQILSVLAHEMGDGVGAGAVAVGVGVGAFDEEGPVDRSSLR